MESLDPFSIMREFGVAVGFAAYLIVQTRIDRADALRREAAYSARLEGIINDMMKMIRDVASDSQKAASENADVMRSLRDQLHELKNVIQRGIVEARRDGDGRRTLDG